MNAPQPMTISEQYDEVDRLYGEALLAIFESKKTAVTRMALLMKLQYEHSHAPTAAAQKEAIQKILDELRG